MDFFNGKKRALLVFDKDGFEIDREGAAKHLGMSLEKHQNFLEQNKEEIEIAGDLRIVYDDDIEALDDFREKRVNGYINWRKAHNGTPIPKTGTEIGDCEIAALRKIAIELELKGIRGNCETLDRMASGG